MAVLSVLMAVLTMSTTMNRAQAVSNFKGPEFGVGLALTIDTGQNERVSDASVVEGFVRVGDEGGATSNVWLESHYF